MKERNEAVRVGDLIPYVICEEKADGSAHGHLSDKAFHVDELRLTPRRLDIEWYLATQVYPPVLRICTHVQAFVPQMLSEAMGIAVSHQAAGNAAAAAPAAGVEDYASHFRSQELDECYPDAVLLQVTCRHCKINGPIQPHKTVKRKVEEAKRTAQLSIPPFSVYECSACHRPIDVHVVATLLQGAIHRMLREFYTNGGTRSELTKLRMQMSYFRHEFDFPQHPGVPSDIRLAHRTSARRYLSETMELRSAAEMEAIGEQGFDPVLELVAATYRRMSQMSVALGELFEGFSHMSS
jgi:DNA polymerase alpha subunit A